MPIGSAHQWELALACHTCKRLRVQSEQDAEHYLVMAYIVMACILTAYTVMAYVVMAQRVMSYAVWHI